MRTRSTSLPPSTKLAGERPWRLVRQYDGEPGLAMARDEALLVEDLDRPCLRLYTWQPDGLSLGYFQRMADVPRAAEATTVVRRWTGGGAIHHANELTFAIRATLTHPLYRGPVAKSYERVHAILIDALAAVGIQAALKGDDRRLSSDDPRTGMCFHESTPQDVIWDDAKGIGSAQRRKADRVLHHGSIKLGTTPLEGPIAVAGVSLDDMESAVLDAFGRAGVSFAEGELSSSETAWAERRASFFRSAEFLRRPEERRARRLGRPEGGLPRQDSNLE